MAILSWGKPKIQHTPSINGAPAAGAVWKDIDTPKEDTTKLTPTAVMRCPPQRREERL